MIYRRSVLLAFTPLALAQSGRGTPDFRGKTLNGTVFTKSSLRGKPVLIQFWATWCGYCRREQPLVEQIVEQYRARLTVLAVSVGEDRETVQKYLAHSPRKSSIVLTEDTNLPAIFRPRGFPHYLMLDSNGSVVAEQRGAAGREGLQELLEEGGLRSRPKPARGAGV